jgi:hypothetical protein
MILIAHDPILSRVFGRIPDGDFLHHLRDLDPHTLCGLEDILSALDRGGVNESMATKKEDRCWPGYEPVKGKAPHSQGSCRPEAESKLSDSEKKFRQKRRKQLDEKESEYPTKRKSALQHLHAPGSKPKTASATKKKTAASKASTATKKRATTTKRTATKKRAATKKRSASR